MLRAAQFCIIFIVIIPFSTFLRITLSPGRPVGNRNPGVLPAVVLALRSQAKGNISKGRKCMVNNTVFFGTIFSFDGRGVTTGNLVFLFISEYLFLASYHYHDYCIDEEKMNEWIQSQSLFVVIMVCWWRWNGIPSSSSVPSFIKWMKAFTLLWHFFTANLSLLCIYSFLYFFFSSIRNNLLTKLCLNKYDRKRYLTWEKIVYVCSGSCGLFFALREKVNENHFSTVYIVLSTFQKEKSEYRKAWNGEERDQANKITVNERLFHSWAQKKEEKSSICRQVEKLACIKNKWIYLLPIRHLE